MLSVLLLFLLSSPGLGLKLNNYYGNGMVLQMDVNNKLWGYGILTTEKVTVSSFYQNGKRLSEIFSPIQVGEDVWEVTISPQPAGTISQILIGSELVLEDVLFGDVWICSGQSNMEQNMLNIENGATETANSAAYEDRIRFTMVSNQVLSAPDDNFDQEMSLPWTYASGYDGLKAMSAVCFLFARNIYDVVGVPMGLVTSDWGGTPVEAWSDQGTLDRCGIPDHVNSGAPQNSNSYLWNGMVNSLKRNAVKGFLWYQGEGNGGYNRDLYNCSFPALIQDWREEFSTHSETSPEAPFGFVQLSTFTADETRNNFPVIRWHQTKDVGYVPNAEMIQVFMSTPLDTYDPAQGYPGGIHPRYKQIVAERLAIAGLNVAYGLKEYPTYGPFPSTVLQYTPTKGGQVSSVRITYDRDIEFVDAEISGFYFCPDLPERCDEGGDASVWKEIPKADVEQSDSRSIIVSFPGGEDLASGSLAYIWRETPVKQLYRLPIYSADEYRLPSPPWKFKIVSP